MPHHNKKLPSLKTVMTPFPHTVDIHSPASDALLRMREHDIRHLPVTEQGMLMGVVSERDIQRALNRESSPSEVLVRDVFRSDVYTANLEEPLPAVLREMAKRQIGSALVMWHGKLSGILTTTDALHALANLIESLNQPPAKGRLF